MKTFYVAPHPPACPLTMCAHIKLWRGVRPLLRTALLSATALSVVTVPTWAQTINAGEKLTIDGTVSVTSTLEQDDDLTIDGALSVINGGSVFAEDDFDGYLGSEEGATGTVEIDGAGSSWTTVGRLFVGDRGTGILTISNGGTVNSDDGGRIGNESSDSDGTVLVTGEGSSWTNADSLRIGDEGTGALTISDGGMVSNGYGRIGSEVDSEGTVLVTGAGSSWTNTDYLSVGDEGTGILTVSEGGTVINTDGSIGVEYTSEGTVLVAGAGSSWTNSEDLRVGVGGIGRLTVSDGGTVNNQEGSIGINEGFLFVPSGEGAVLVTGEGSSWNNEVSLEVGAGGIGSLTISDGGTVNVDGIVRVATDAASRGTINIGAAAGEEAVGAGILDTSVVKFGDGEGLLVFNHTDTDYVFEPTINGAGDVAVYSGTTIFERFNGYSGDTTLWGGQLIVNGSLGGGTIINDTGVLGGSGTVGAITVNAGGTLAPGSSIGTLNATDVAFEEGGRYAVEVNAAGESDLLAATGEVIINAGVILDVSSETLGEDGRDYNDEGTDYTIITAENGLIGAFDTVVDSFAFLDAELSYDGNAAYLSLMRNGFSFADLAQTPNQIATADGVESLGVGADLYEEIVGLDQTETAPAFDALSGEAHASAKTHLIQNGAVVADVVLGNTRDDIGGTPVVTQSAGSGTSDHKAWGALIGAWSETDGTTNVAALKQTQAGAVAGVETFVSPNLRLGVVLGVSGSDYEVADRLSSGSVDAAYLGVYGETRSGALDLRFGANVGAHQIKSERSVTVGAITEELTAEYGAQSTTLFAEASYAFPQVSPFFNATHVMLKTDGFTESGGSTALTVDGSSQDVTFATLGMRAERDVMLGSVPASLAGVVAWRHAAGDIASQINVALDGSSAFSIEGAPIAADTGVIGAGIDFDLDAQTQIGFGYAGQLSDSSQSHTLQVGLTRSF